MTWHRGRVALAALVGAAALTLAACGGSAAGSTGGSDGTSPGAGGGSNSSSSSTSSSTTTTTTLAPLRAPVTLLEIGDSLGEDLGIGLQDVLGNDQHVTVIQAAKGDSGLVEPQFYNWPVALRSLLEQHHPQVVVVFLGANDVQNFYDGNTLETVGTPSWKAAYGQRVAQMMNEATSAGARVLWVGMPIMQSPTFSASMQVLDGVYRAEAASHRGVTYFSSWPLFTTPAGAYTATTVVNGQTIELRDPDGIHIPVGLGLGDDYLAKAVVAKMKLLWGFP